MDFNGYVVLKMDYGFTNLYVKNKKRGEVCKRLGFILSTSGANFVKKHLKDYKYYIFDYLNRCLEVIMEFDILLKFLHGLRVGAKSRVFLDGAGVVKPI